LISPAQPATFSISLGTPCRYNLESLIQPFIDYLKFEKRYSIHTIRSYQDDLSQFAVYLEQTLGATTLKDISPSFVRSWLASLKDQGISSRSITRKISTLKSFFKFQLKRGVLEQTPMTHIHIPKSAKRLPVFVSEKEIGNLFSLIEFPDNWQGRTDRLLLSVFYNTGMRLSELINLREDKIDFSRHLLKVLGKGNKERFIPISPGLAKDIKGYLSEKKESVITGASTMLFVNEKGKNLYPKRKVPRVPLFSFPPKGHANGSERPGPASRRIAGRQHPRLHAGIDRHRPDVARPTRYGSRGRACSGRSDATLGRSRRADRAGRPRPQP